MGGDLKKTKRLPPFAFYALLFQQFSNEAEFKTKKRQ